MIGALESLWQFELYFPFLNGVFPERSYFPRKIAKIFLRCLIAGEIAEKLLF